MIGYVDWNIFGMIPTLENPPGKNCSELGPPRVWVSEYELNQRRYVSCNRSNGSHRPDILLEHPPHPIRCRPGLPCLSGLTIHLAGPDTGGGQMLTSGITYSTVCFLPPMLLPLVSIPIRNPIPPELILYTTHRPRLAMGML